MYEKLGFFREEKMSKYYLNGGDAYRLKLWIERADSRTVDENIALTEQADEVAVR